mgnify:CR=1 FL=1
MEISTSAIVCSVRNHGETGAIVRAFSADDGMLAGYVQGARGRQLRPVLIPGNVITGEWRTRITGQLARLTPDLVYDQLIAAGCAKKLIYSWAGNPGVGSLHAFRRALEAQVGTVLLVRSRPVKPTAAGRLLIKHAMQMRLLRADLENDLHELTPATKGSREEDRVSIAVNADSIATWVLPAVGPLVSEGLPLEIITDDQDFTHEWLREGQVLGCITTLKQALRGCKVVRLGAMDYVAVAAPAFAQERLADGLLTAHNFRDIPFVAFNRKDDLQAEFVGRACGLRRVHLRQRFVPSSEGQVRAALAGWGATVVPELQARGILMDGSTANGEKRLLLQIFSQTLLGPVFFEFIQRKADEGFGEGNFKALFESLERDQIRRGAIAVDPS